MRENRGALTVLEPQASSGAVPFDIARVYWMYDIPADAEREGHAMLSQSELVIALAGSLDVVINDGHSIRRFHLDRNYRALYIPPLTWREIDNFSTNAMTLTLSSALYDENDYIRSWNRYVEIINTVNQEP